MRPRDCVPAEAKRPNADSLYPPQDKRDDLTKESWTDDGWFMTGDIAQWNKDGTLSVIDRKKNLVKLAGGEYIALERLECVEFSGAALDPAMRTSVRVSRC